MGASYFPSFHLARIDADGVRIPLANEEISIREFGGADITTAESDDFGYVASASIGADAGTEIEFYHDTYPNTIRMFTADTEAETYSEYSTFIVEDLYEETIEPEIVDIYLEDQSNPEFGKKFVASAAPGSTIAFPYETSYPKSVTLFVVPRGVTPQVTSDFLEAEQTDVVVDPSSSMTIGQTIGGSTPNRFLVVGVGNELAEMPFPLSIGSGGTGQTTANAAFNALAPAQASQSGKFLTTDGSNTSWGTVSTGLTIGSTPITGGTNGSVLFIGSGNLQQDNANFSYDDANNRLNVNGNYLYSGAHASNLFIGNNAGNLTANAQNIAIGQNAGTNITSGYNNTLLGVGSGNLITTGQANSFFGYGAGAAVVSGVSNTFIGAHAGNAYTGSGGTFIGSDAGKVATGIANTFIGSQSGQATTTGQDNTFLGYQSGFNSTSSSNVLIGATAGFSQTSGQNNVALGWRAGYSNVTGSRNVFLGNDAGYSETGSEKLYIANIFNDYLIYGEFNNHLVKINGSLEAVKTTRQGRFAYDGSNYLDITVASNGATEYDIVGSSPAHKFMDNVELASGKDLIITSSKIGQSGSAIGFFGVAPSAQSTGWEVINFSPLKTWDGASDGQTELNRVFCTFINEWLNKGLIGGV